MVGMPQGIFESQGQLASDLHGSASRFRIRVYLISIVPLPSTAAHAALAIVFVRTEVAATGAAARELCDQAVDFALTSASSGCVAMLVPTPLAISGLINGLVLANAMVGEAAKFSPGK